MARESVSSGSVQIEGLASLQKQLKLLETDKADLLEANLHAAETLIRAAQPLMPVLTGNLKATLRPSKTARFAQASAGNARVPYANPIHWGWSVVGANHRGTLAPGTPRNIEPTPFFAKALGYTYEAIIKNYQDDLQRLINKYGLGAD
jgi:hypothetical protein